MTGDASVLADAQQAAAWIEAHRGLPDGGYSHDTQDVAGPYLGDTLAMGEAWLSLYGHAERTDLAAAQAVADFIGKNFSTVGTPGLVTAVSKSRFNRLHPQADENVAAVRFANLLSRYTGKQEYRKLADRAMRYLAAPEIAEVYSASGILLADTELHSDPTHLTIVARKGDANAHALLVTALGFPGAYKRVESWIARKGRFPTLTFNILTWNVPQPLYVATIAALGQRLLLTRSRLLRIGSLTKPTNSGFFLLQGRR